MILAVIGNTVKLSAEFRTWAGDYGDPTDIVLKIFDHNKVQIGYDIPITSTNKISTGIYQYDYTIPRDAYLGYGFPMYFEFLGILEGSPISGRGTFTREWIN